MHKINTPQKSKSERQLRTMTKTMTERWPFSLFLSPYYRHIPTESAKMASFLVRIYSFSLLLLLLLFLLLLLLLFFQSLAHFMPTNTKPSGTIGDTQKTMTISATSFRGCNRFSPLLIWIHLVPWFGGHFPHKKKIKPNFNNPPKITHKPRCKHKISPRFFACVTWTRNKPILAGNLQRRLGRSATRHGKRLFTDDSWLAGCFQK